MVHDIILVKISRQICNYSNSFSNVFTFLKYPVYKILNYINIYNIYIYTLYIQSCPVHNHLLLSNDLHSKQSYFLNRLIRKEKRGLKINYV